MTAALMEWLASASALIVVVLLLRRLLRERISAGLRYGLWAVVLIRLLVPVSFFSLSVAVPQLPKWDPPEAMQEETIYVFPVSSLPLEQSSVHVEEDGTLIDPNSFGYPRLTDNGERVVRYADKISPLELLKWVWIAGAAVMGIVLVVTNFRFSRRLRRVRRPLVGTNAPVPVYVAPALPSPCLVGLFFPAVYVTEEAVADPAMLWHVLAHELTHYNHRDHLWSVLRGAALAVHWWNPLVWLAVVCSRRDGELACDEGALKQLGDSERAAYGETLLTLVTAKARPADLLSFTTTMSGGKRSLRERIQRIAHQPKQLASAVAAVVIVLSVSVLVAFGQAKELWIDPDSVTGFTAFIASSHTITPNTIVYTPADLQKDMQTLKHAAFVSREDGMELIDLINAHGKRVYGQGELTLNGPEHHFVKIDCTDGGFYLLDYWYWNSFSLNPLHLGEDDFTTLITHYDADGKAGTTWQMDYYFDLVYSPTMWSAAVNRKTPDTAASGSDVTDAAAWRAPDIVLTVDGVLELGYDIPGGGVEIVRSNPVPAPREWANIDPLTLDSRTRATALEGLPIIWAELVNPTDGWLVACYGRGVTIAGTYVYKTEDGGMNWTEVTMPGTNWHIADVGFLSPERLIVAQRLFDGAPCMITKDRGETWEEIELPDVQVLDISYSRGFLTMWIGQHEGDPATFSMTSTDLGDHWETVSSEESYARDHPDDTWSPLADLLLELTEEDIATFNGDASELVRYLQEAERGSRFYTWDSYASAYDGHGIGERSYALLDVPLADGSVLHLCANMESDSVFMAWETSVETVAAFYDAPELNNMIRNRMAVPSMSNVLANLQAEDIRSGYWNINIDTGALADALHRAANNLTYSRENSEVPLYLMYFTCPNLPDRLIDVAEIAAMETEGVVRIICQCTTPVLQYSENPDNDATYLTNTTCQLAAYVEDEQLYQLLCERGVSVGEFYWDVYRTSSFTLMVPSPETFTVTSFETGVWQIVSKEDPRAKIEIFLSSLTPRQIHEQPGLLFEGVTDIEDMVMGQGSGWDHSFYLTSSNDEYSCRPEVHVAARENGSLVQLVFRPDDVDEKVSGRIGMTHWMFHKLNVREHE